MDTAASIEEVIARYSTTVYGVALTHTAQRADADDVFQEVFATYWKQQPHISSEEHRKAWLIRTTLNFCLKLTQSSWAKKTILSDDPREQGQGAREEQPYSAVEHTSQTGNAASAESSFVELSFVTDEQNALYRALCTLPTSYKTVVQLFYFEDLSIAQIAEVLELEQGAVKTRLSRARAELRKKLKDGNRDD